VEELSKVFEISSHNVGEFLNSFFSVQVKKCTLCASRFILIEEKKPDNKDVCKNLSGLVIQFAEQPFK
jgi:hypothetical protein